MVAAVAARDPARARQFAAAARHRHGVHDSYEALIADPDIDAIYNPLPNGAARAVDAAPRIAAGKHVLCEKPFTVERGRGGRGGGRRAAAGLVVMEAFHYRYHPLARADARDRRRAASWARSGTSRPRCASRCRSSPTSATSTTWPAAPRWTPAATRSTASACSARASRPWSPRAGQAARPGRRPGDGRRVPVPRRRHAGAIRASLWSARACSGSAPGPSASAARCGSLNYLAPQRVQPAHGQHRHEPPGGSGSAARPPTSTSCARSPPRCCAASR